MAVDSFGALEQIVRVGLVEKDLRCDVLWGATERVGASAWRQAFGPTSTLNLNSNPTLDPQPLALNPSPKPAPPEPSNTKCLQNRKPHWTRRVWGLGLGFRV